jgi:hypothetical protein
MRTKELERERESGKLSTKNPNAKWVIVESQFFNKRLVLFFLFKISNINKIKYVPFQIFGKLLLCARLTIILKPMAYMILFLVCIKNK